MENTVKSLAKEIVKAMALPHVEQQKIIADINKRGKYVNISPNEIGAFAQLNYDSLQAEIEKEKTPAGK